MALNQTTTASGFYINTNSSTTKTFTRSVRADVDSTVIPVNLATGFVQATPSKIGLTPSIHVTNPGVFTIGTAPEGTLSNPTNDSNG